LAHVHQHPYENCAGCCNFGLGNRKALAIFINDDSENNHDARDHLPHKITQTVKDEAVGEYAYDAGSEQFDERKYFAVIDRLILHRRTKTNMAREQLPKNQKKIKSIT
jgi:hypothetical protein